MSPQLEFDDSQLSVVAEGCGVIVGTDEGGKSEVLLDALDDLYDLPGALPRPAPRPLEVDFSVACLSPLPALLLGGALLPLPLDAPFSCVQPDTSNSESLAVGNLSLSLVPV